MQGKGKCEYRFDRSCAAGHGFAHSDNINKTVQMLSVNRLGVAYDFPREPKSMIVIDIEVMFVTRLRHVFRCCKAMHEPCASGDNAIISR